MEINGPIRIKVINEPGTAGWQLLLYFTDEFKQASLEEQGRIFKNYVIELDQQIKALPAGDRNRDGMALVFQLCWQMLPHIQAGEIALEESILVQIEQQQAVALTDLLNG